MANASADKLKALALRHSEKAVMGVTALLCLFFLYTALTMETIDVTPEQVKQAADQAQSNLARKQEPSDILKLLEEQNIKNPGFEAMVDSQEKNVLVAANFRPPQLWVSPEPGAGLIRDQPELFAVTELYAYPGRGGALVYELDDAGNRIPDPDADKHLDEATKTRRQIKAPLSRSAAMAKGNEARKKEEEKKKVEIERKQKMARLAGGTDVKKEEAAPEVAAADVRMKEKTVGIRWVAITGVLNYKALRDSYLLALKRPEVAFPHFKQLDIERQVKQSDGSWSDWEAVDQARNLQILDNLPEEDEEWTPETVRISTLVAPLPFLRAGFWERVHIGRMVPAEKVKVADPVFTANAGLMSGSAMDAPPMAVAEPVSSARMDMPNEMPMSMSYGGGMGGETVDFEKKPDVDEIMIRALDLTVEPDTTYRFRVRTVVYNPNLGHEDVSPGVDKTAVELNGPWSEPTEEVTMPPDVATYALNREPNVPRKLDQVNFEVARWSPDDGVTVVKRFSAAPGEIIGDVSSVTVPIADGATKKGVPRKIDFNSHQLVLDVMGGDQPIPALGPGTGGRLAVPALSLVVRRDGAVVIRNQANDLHDQVRKDMADNFARELKVADEEKKKKRSGGGLGGSSAPGSMP